MDNKLKKFKRKLQMSDVAFDFWMRLSNMAERISQFAFNRASDIADKNAKEMYELLNGYPEQSRKELQNYIEGIEES